MTPVATTWGALPPTAFILGADGEVWTAAYSPATRVVTAVSTKDPSLPLARFAAEPDGPCVRMVTTEAEAEALTLSVFPGAHVIREDAS